MRDSLTADILDNDNIALNKPTIASSVQPEDYEENYIASNAVDGTNSTRWASVDFSQDLFKPVTPQWIYVDLTRSYNVNRVKLSWEIAFAKSYKIQVSNDAQVPKDDSGWTDVYSTTTGSQGTHDIEFIPTMARYVRMLGLERGTEFGYSLREFSIYSVEPIRSTASNVIKFDNNALLEITDSKKYIDFSKDFTIAFLVNFNSINCDIKIFKMVDFEIWISEKKITLHFLRTSKSITRELPVEKLQEKDWYSIAITCSNSTGLTSWKRLWNIIFDGSQDDPVEEEELYHLTTTTTTMTIGENLSGYISYFAIYNRCVKPKTLLGLGYNKPDMTDEILRLWVSGDTGKITNDSKCNYIYDIALKGECEVVNITNCHEIAYGGSIHPVNDITVNPGGDPVGPYTLSSKIYFFPVGQVKYYIASNSDINNDSGMSLYLEQDPNTKQYKIFSQRGQDLDSDDKLSAPFSDKYLNCWVDVATVFDGTTLKIYINGNEVACDTTCLPNTQYRKKGSLIIGDSIHDPTDNGIKNFSGYIQNLYVFNKALNEEEINSCITGNVLNIDGATGLYDLTVKNAVNVTTGNIATCFNNSAFVVAENTYPIEDYTTYEDKYKNYKVIRPTQPCPTLTDKDVEKIKEIWQKKKNDSNKVYVPMINKFIEFPRQKSEDFIKNIKAGDKLRNQVWNYTENGKVYFACNCPYEGEKIIGVVDVDKYDDETIWRAKVGITVVAGIIDVVFCIGLASQVNEALIKFTAEKIITLVAFKKIIALGSMVSAGDFIVDILAFVGSVFNAGILKQMLKTFFKVTFFTLVKLIAKLTALCLGWGWVPFTIELTALAYNVILLFEEKYKDKEEESRVDYVLDNVIFRHSPTKFQNSSAYIKESPNAFEQPYAICGGISTGEPILYYSNKLKEPEIKVSLTASSFNKNVPNEAEIEIQIDSCILSNAPSVKVKFVNGKQVPEYAVLKPTIKFAPGQMGRETAIFKWVANGKLIDTTSHEIYLLDNLPSEPWEIYRNSEKNVPVYFLDTFFDYVYSHTNSEQPNEFSREELINLTPSEKGKAITNMIYYSSRIQYDGFTHCTESRGGIYYYIYSFNYENYISNSRDATKKDTFINMNCLDCAALTCSYFKLGGFNDTLLACILPNESTFWTNKIKLIGCHEWVYQEYTYHAVCSYTYKDKRLNDTLIWDSCLAYDASNTAYNEDKKQANATIPFQTIFSKFESNLWNPSAGIVYNPDPPPFTPSSYREYLCWPNIKDNTDQRGYVKLNLNNILELQENGDLPIYNGIDNTKHYSMLKKYAATIITEALVHKRREKIVGRNFKDIYESPSGEQLEVSFEYLGTDEEAETYYNNKVLLIPFYEKTEVSGFQNATITETSYCKTYILQKNSYVVTVAYNTALAEQGENIIKNLATT